MKVKDIEPGVVYADCNGNAVRPVEPIASDYVWRQVADADGETHREAVRLSETASQADPWATCDVGSRREKGVLCDRIAAHFPGDELEVLGQTIVTIRNLKGTWAQYAALHGHTVKVDVEDREAARLARERSRALSEELAELSASGLVLDVHAEHRYARRYNYEKKGHDRYLEERYSITFVTKDYDEALHFARTLAAR